MLLHYTISVYTNRLVLQMSGLYPQGIRKMDAEDMLQEFNVNVASTHRVTSAFIPLLQQGKQKKIVMM